MKMDNRQVRLKETASQVTVYDKGRKIRPTARLMIAQYGTTVYCIRLCGRKPAGGAS